MKLFTAFIFVLCCLLTTFVQADNCDTPNNDLTVPAESTFDGNITGYCNVTIGDKSRVRNGGITADGNVVLGTSVTVSGAINAGGKVTIGTNSTVQNNDIVAGGDVVLDSNSRVDGNIISSGSIIIGENATVQNGNVTAVGEVTLKNGSRVNNNVVANGNITIEAGTVQNGDITSDGNITLEEGATVPNGDVTAEGLVFLNGNVSIGNGSVCGKSGVDATEAVDGSGINENRIHVGENCNDQWDGNPTVDFCANPVDISGYQIHNGNYTLGANVTNEVSAIYSGLYVDGKVTLNNGSLFIGNIYATGAVELKNGATVQGDVHTENTVTLKNNANISGGTCENVEPVTTATYTFTFDNTQPQALVCEAHIVDIQIRLNNTLNANYNETVTLSTDTGLGDWTILDTNNARGVLSNGAAGDGNATYTFSNNDDGQIQLGLSHAQAGDVKLLVSNSDANATFDLNFSSTVLKIAQSCVDDSLGACINTANLPFNVTITAFKEDQQTNTCVTYNPNKILFWSEYITPAVPEGIAIEIDGNEIGNLMANATPLNVAFNSGVATLSINYPDAGKIKIHAQDQDDLAAIGEVQTIINPVQLLIDNIMGNSMLNSLQNNNPETTDNGNGFIRASVVDYDDLQVDTFNIHVTALKDCSNDTKGHCSGIYGQRAPSFANEVDLETSLIFPNAGALGQLQYNGVGGTSDYQASLTSGQFTYENLAYDEVGTLGLLVKTKDDDNGDGYLIAGNHINSINVQSVGRFYPDYLAFNSFVAIPACNDDFTYLGQTAIDVNYNLKAYTQGALNVTTNYDHSLGYPVAGKGNVTAFSDQIYDQGPLSLTSRLLPDAYYEPTLWLQGQYDVIGLQMGVAKTTSPDGPYFTNTNKIDYFIKLIGIDGEKIQMDSTTTCSDDSCFIGDLGNLVYGRLQAGNGHGSEFQAITTDINATYYQGRHFLDFTRDVCTTTSLPQISSIPTIDNSNAITVTEPITGNTGQTTLAIINSPMINGLSQLTFSAPNNRGNLDYYIETYSVAPWLLDSGNAVDCPNGIADSKECIAGAVEFGLFRGNDRIIYRLQTFD